MNKRTLLIILIFNIFALPLLIMGGVFWILYKNGIIPYLFGQVGDTAILKLVITGIIIEGIMLFVLAIVNKNFVIFVPNIALGFITLVLMFIAFGQASYTYERKLSSFNEKLVIDNFSALFAGRSTVYEKTSFCTLREVCIVSGDDGARPLKDPKSYIIKEYSNGFSIEYRDDGKNHIVYIQYKDGNFFEVKTDLYLQ